MRVLFLHPNFPAQFRHVATLLGKDPKNQLVFGTKTENNLQISGVHKVMYSVAREPNPQTHHYIRVLEGAVLQGQAVYRMCDELKKKGFYPDLVYSHSAGVPVYTSKMLFPEQPTSATLNGITTRGVLMRTLTPTNPSTPMTFCALGVRTRPF